MAVNLAAEGKAGKKAARKPTPRARRVVEVSDTFKVELTMGPTASYTEASGTTWYGNRVYPVTAAERSRLFALQDDWGRPYFRDAVPRRAPRQAVEEETDEPQNMLVLEGDGIEEIDTADKNVVVRPRGVVRLPRAMRTSESGGVKV